jgi:hypothetical protein
MLAGKIKDLLLRASWVILYAVLVRTFILAKKLEEFGNKSK